MNAKDYGEHVFVVGSSRSGTTLVNTILLSCPLYAVYRAETQILNGCDTKYGDLANKRSREIFLSDWFRSRQFLRSGLTKEEFLGLLNSTDTHSYIRLLSKFMNMVAAKQQRDRWVDSTPGNISALAEISDYFPNAKVIHVIRDGRAVALSRTKLGWSGVNTNNFEKALGYSALMWENSVLAARKARSFLPRRYIEVRYEQLVECPDYVVNSLSEFLNLPNLGYEHINKGNDFTRNGSSTPIRSTNSAFGDMSAGISKQAAYRWKDSLTKDQISRIESFVGQTLETLGYPLVTNKKLNLKYSIEKLWIRSFIKAKSHIKKIATLGRLGATPLEVGVD